MAKHGLWIGALMGLSAVIFGTFGAHGLETMLGGSEALSAEELAKRHDNWAIGVRYLMYHAIVVFIIGMMGQFNRHQALTVALYLLTGGTVIFSGALFVLTLTGMKWLGMVAPIGGVGMTLGWAALVMVGWAATQPKKKKKKKEQTN